MAVNYRLRGIEACTHIDAVIASKIRTQGAFNFRKVKCSEIENGQNLICVFFIPSPVRFIRYDIVVIAVSLSVSGFC
jgi:hypothetical protein